jgi:hypothetical protein
LINNDETWTNIKINYLACSRADFWVGTFIGGNSNIYLDPYWLNGNAIGGSLNFKHRIVDWQPKFNESYTTIVLISGFKTLDSYYNLDIT